MRGQSEVYEVISSSLVVNSVYSVMVDIDTVAGVFPAMPLSVCYQQLIMKIQGKFMKIALF